MSPFRTLGLPADAGAAEIKRAYARLLRTHRPDVDPDGFQRIHEAYQACLQQLQWREQGLLDDDEDDLDDAVERLAFASTQTADAGAGAGGEPHAASPRADADADADAGDATQAGFAIDAFMAALAVRLKEGGLRLGGVVQHNEGDCAEGCQSMALEDLASGVRFPISENRGAAASGCRLDAAGRKRTGGSRCTIAS